MKFIIKLAGAYFIAGIATEAGVSLWRESLKGKTVNMISNLKKKFQKKGS